MRTSLAVQWLGLCPSTAETPGLIPGQGTKIPQATWWCGPKTNKTNEKKDSSWMTGMLRTWSSFGVSEELS